MMRVVGMIVLSLAVAGCASLPRGTDTLRIESVPSANTVQVSYLDVGGATTVTSCTTPCSLKIPNGAGISLALKPPAGYAAPANVPKLEWTCDTVAGVCTIAPNPVQIAFRKIAP